MKAERNLHRISMVILELHERSVTNGFDQQ